MSAAPAAHLIIKTGRVGDVVAAREVEVTFQRSAAYAAAIGAERDVYLDDRRQEGALAPPSFITSLEWPLVRGASALDAMGVDPGALFGSLLHAFQDTRFGRPLRVGDRLRQEASLASVRQTAAGVIAVTRILSTEIASGAMVAESWFGAFYRDAGTEMSVEAFGAPAIERWAGRPSDEMVLPALSRGRAHIYAECAELWNPIHTEPGFAESRGLSDVVLHGTLVWAMTGEAAIDRFMAGDPTRLHRLAMRFNKPMLPGPGAVLQFSAPHNDCRQVAVWMGEDRPVAEGAVDFRA